MTNMSGLQDEVIWVREDIVVMEATRVEAVHAVRPSTQEAAAVRERVEAST
jgi:hypothetical protein